MSTATTDAETRSHRTTVLRVLRVTVLAVVTVCVVGGIPAFVQQQNPLIFIAVAAYLAVGVVVTGRQPGNAVGWVFLGVALLGALPVLGNELTHRAFVEFVPAGTPPPTWEHPLLLEGLPWWATLGAWLNSWTFYALLDLAIAWTLFLFPGGRPMRGWRPVFAVNAVAVVLLTLLGAFARPVVGIGSDHDLQVLCGPEGKPSCAVIATNPFALPFVHRWGLFDIESTTIFNAIAVIGVATAFLSVAHVVVRFWRSRGVERKQLQWLVLAGSLVLVTYALDFVVSRLPSWAGDTLQGVVIAFVPVSCGIAILRYRLYDIDRIISRTASYAVVTGALLLLYAGIVTSVTRLVGSASTLTVAAATLAAAALFRPLLRRVQRVVDRRFNREKVDAQAAVAEFGSRLTDEVDDERAESELIDVTRRTLQPESVSLWVNEEKR